MAEGIDALSACRQKNADAKIMQSPVGELYNGRQMLKSLLDEYSDLFNSSLGYMKSIKASLMMDLNVQPRKI